MKTVYLHKRSICPCCKTRQIKSVLHISRASMLLPHHQSSYLLHIFILFLQTFYFHVLQFNTKGITINTTQQLEVL